MRMLIVVAHPSPDSRTAHLARSAQSSAAAAGHEVDFWDLTAEGFDPVLSAAEWQGYRAGLPAPAMAAEIARLQRAEALILIFPTWWGGPPAVLKGWFDRLFRPGVAFRLDGAVLRPGLTDMRHLGVVTSYGGPRWAWVFTGMPGKRMILRGLRVCLPRDARCFWLGMALAETALPTAHDAFIAHAVARIAGLR